MKKHLLGSIFALGIAGCSSETGGNIPPDPNGPEGAVNMEVYTNDAQNCPLHNVHIDVGNTKVSPPELVVNGAGGATVACSVKDMGGQFAATATITKGSFAF